MAVNLNNFTPLSGGASLFSIEQDASPELYTLAKAYPNLLSRALRHVAYITLMELKQAIRMGGPAGTTWPERSQMHQYRRLDMWFNQRDVSLKQKTNSGRSQLSRTGLRRAGKNIGGRFSLLGNFGENERRSYRYWTRGGRMRDTEQSIPDAFTRWKSPHGRSGHRNPISMSGYIYTNLAYKKESPLRYGIGALSPRIVEFLDKVQKGKTTVITPAMRRSFWAAGVPLNANKTTLVMPPRPLVDPVFRKMRPKLNTMLIERIRYYLEKQ